jgi:hypothetical protein
LSVEEKYAPSRVLSFQVSATVMELAPASGEGMAEAPVASIPQASSWQQ